MVGGSRSRLRLTFDYPPVDNNSILARTSDSAWHSRERVVWLPRLSDAFLVARRRVIQCHEPYVRGIFTIARNRSANSGLAGMSSF
jgi:hypothetical protein